MDAHTYAIVFVFFSLSPLSLSLSRARARNDNGARMTMRFVDERKKGKKKSQGAGEIWLPIQTPLVLRGISGDWEASIDFGLQVFVVDWHDNLSLISTHCRKRVGEQRDKKKKKKTKLKPFFLSLSLSLSLSLFLLLLLLLLRCFTLVWMDE